MKSTDLTEPCDARSGAPVRLDAELAERYRALRERTDDAWIALANALGFRVVREHGAFVAYDGHGTIAVAPYEALDDDDCLAQIVLHELCHHWVQGVDSRHEMDWGLNNTDATDEDREHLALELQAALLAAHGLARVLVPTTDFRPYYERLLDPAVHLAPPARGLGITERVPVEVRVRLHDALAAAADSARGCGFNVVPPTPVC